MATTKTTAKPPPIDPMDDKALRSAPGAAGSAARPAGS